MERAGYRGWQTSREILPDRKAALATWELVAKEAVRATETRSPRHRRIWAVVEAGVRGSQLVLRYVWDELGHPGKWEGGRVEAGGWGSHEDGSRSC